MTTPNEELILKLRGQAYTTCRPDQLCDQAADLLQSQAERIKKLEFESSTHLRMRNLHYGENGKLRDQLAGMTANTATDKHLVDLANDTATRLLKERDTLRAEIAGTAAVEPVATLVVEWVFHEYDNSAKEDRAGYVSASFHRTAAAEKMPIGKYALFTRPMPAQDVTELVEALEGLLDAADDSDGCQYGTLSTSFVRDIASTALSKYRGAKR